MKKQIYLSLLAVPMMIAGSAIASELSVGMADHSKFILAFDNATYTTPSNTYNVTNVVPGMHHLRMTSAMGPMNGAYGIPRLLYDGWVNIPVNARVTASAMNINQLSISSIVPLVQYCQGYYDPNNPYGNGYYDPNNPYGNGYYDPNNPYGNGYYDPNNPYGSYDPNYTYGSNTGYPNGGYGNGGYGNGGWNTPPPVYQMSATDFEALKNSVRAQGFDSSRLTVAEQAVGMNHLSSAQVLELMKEFTFESTKLDFAKFAYGKAIDRNNYYLVNNGFAYSSSIDELAEYINNYHA